jgi:hypothetical protein
MGRRVQPGQARPLLARFVAHAASVLAPGGRIVWVTPSCRDTDPAVQAAGLAVTVARDVDMGGFSARLQRLERAPAAPPARRPPR